MSLTIENGVHFSCMFIIGFMFGPKHLWVYTLLNVATSTMSEQYIDVITRPVENLSSSFSVIQK